MEQQPSISATLAQVGARLRRIRTQRGVSLSALAEATGISKSTLSRLESNQRRPSLELLLPIAQARRRSVTRAFAASPSSATGGPSCP
jgi:transcriptional regulator with XRE-family HTH domain